MSDGKKRHQYFKSEIIQFTIYSNKWPYYLYESILPNLLISTKPDYISGWCYPAYVLQTDNLLHM